jgi:hypothetical protein
VSSALLADNARILKRIQNKNVPLKNAIAQWFTVTGVKVGD